MGSKTPSTRNPPHIGGDFFCLQTAVSVHGPEIE